MTAEPSDPMARRVFVVGSTGYIGRQVVQALVARGHQVVAFARRRSGVGGRATEVETDAALVGAQVRYGDVNDPLSLARDGFGGEAFEVIVSCLATRTGAPADAWQIEHQANLNVLAAGRAAGVRHFVLLSAICVQKPKLEFQHAKLAFERALSESGLDYSIVRPTAFFKSLSGQVAKVQAGGAFAIFGDGQRTACKPISERDLAQFIAACLEDPDKRNAILPIGGPGPAITPLQQGTLLFTLAGRTPHFRRVPVGLLDVIIGVLAGLGRIFPRLADQAERARIGRYYATESMLLWDPRAGRYDPELTPSFGADTLEDFYARVLREGLAGQELGDHAVFSRPRKR